MSIILTTILNYKFNIAITVFILLLQAAIIKFATPRIEKHTDHSRLKRDSFDKARKSLIFVSNTISIALILFVWGFDFKGLMTMSAGLLALLGVSLFASWSILSNVTAFFLLIFHKSYKRGNFIRIIIGENYVEGYISEINLFNTKLISEDKEIIVYPNILLMSHPAIINPRSRYSVVGKVVEFSNKEISIET
ncbi:MAG: mechanosensitive ion channel family protein [Gammaproteobacteria bacterium]|nr:mechanosensitive ion channel family protein [Gammaproteobacteria bacterium]